MRKNYPSIINYKISIKYSTSKYFWLSKFVLLILLFSFNSIAQVANYTFGESTGTYSNLVAPTTAIASGWDDAVTLNTIPIGFTFGFSGSNYTTCSINSNGFITFGSTLASNVEYNPISSGTTYERAIVALGVDIRDDNTQTISYLTTGSAPNRIFTVQWRDIRRVGRGGQFNFQIQLSETSNIIKIVYGLCSPTGNNAQNINVQVGLRGASSADYNNRSLTTNAVVWDNNTIAGTTNNATCRTRSSNYPNSGRTFIWTPLLPPTITGLGASNGCVGSTITINGTNLIGITAANVKIGGTAVTSIVTNTGTQITATIANGTTGLVTVQNLAGTGTSTSSFTVNPLPIITAQPATPIAICTNNFGTLSVIATGATTYQWRKNGVNLTNVLPYSNVTTSTITITNPSPADAGTYDVVASNASGCSVTSNGSTLTVNTIPTIATTPTPLNGATGQCFSGSGAITSVSWAAVAGAVNYDVYFGAGSLPGSVTSANLAATTYTTGALAASTLYYWKIVAKNTCGSAVGSSTWTFTTLATTCICAPTYSSSPNIYGDQISNVTLGVLNNSSGGATVAPYYTYYNTLPIPNLQVGLTYPISVTFGPDANQFSAVWIDFNNDSVFAPAEGFISANAGANGTAIFNITVPPGATLGNVRMRVRGGDDNPLTNLQACGASSSIYGETEDYIVNLVNIVCTAPAPPTALSLSPNNTSISGSFTFPTILADEYMVVQSLNPIAPTPTPGTTYTIGSTVGLGYTVIDKDFNTIFSTTGLTPGVTYYFYVFSIKSICSGGPIYSSVLSGNIATTLTSQGCIDATSSSKIYLLNTFQTVGNLTNMSNTNTGYTNSGYTDYTSLPTTTQIPGGGINCKFATNLSVTVKTWVDWNRDGVFDDTTERVYDSGSYIAASTSFGFVVPISALGNYRLRIRIAYLPLASVLPCGNLANGETEDYKLTIVADCAAKITNVVDGKRCDTGTMVLSATATPTATEFRWYNAEVGGTLIGTSYKIGLTNDSNWTTPSLSTTTIYWVEAWSPTCASFFREKVIAKVNLTSIITFNPTAPIVCGENNIIAVNATGDFEVFDLINEDFEDIPQMNTVNISSNGFEWTTKSSTFVPTGTALWRPAINSRNSGNKFSYTCSNLPSLVTKSSLISNTLDTTGFTDLTLTFRHYFSYYPSPGDNGYIQVSTNGGLAWNTIQNYQSDIGEAGSFAAVTILLPTYINQNNLKIRFYYNSTGGNGWAIDDIRLYGTKPINTTFTWGGGADAYADAAALIPYDPLTMSLNTVFIKPTPAQLASPTWSFTANATIANGCVVSKAVVVTNNTKKWLGLTSNWSTGSNWEPSGVPTNSNCVIIPNTSIISGSNVTGYGKNLIIKSTGKLTVQSSNNLIIEDLINVNTGGIFNLENNSSLVQTNNVTNLGDINYNRLTPNIRGYDYIYWSSPVLNQNINNIYSSPTQGPKYLWNTVGSNPNSGLGNWNDATGQAMNVGQGYIVRGSSTYYMPATSISSNFKGIPNNGDLSIKIKRGDMTTATVPSIYSNSGLSIYDDNWSLLGNPYPSAINGLQFLKTNAANIVGTLYLWRHLNDVAAIASPFYQNYIYNYNSSDYLAVNFTGPTTPSASEVVKTGQAFLVQRKEGPQDLVGVDILFNNAMRVNIGVPYANDNFYRNAAPVTTIDPTAIERHRIWLDLITDSTQLSETTLLGYIEGATQDFDNLFDGPFSLSDLNKVYTVLDDKKLIIQGKQLPFDSNDQVQLGLHIIADGNYHIAINTVDGLFTNQDIFLQDNLLNITQDLKAAPYSFSSVTGTFTDRFVLKYINTNLSNNQFTTNNEVKILTNENISLSSNNLQIKKIEVYDLLGRKIDKYENVNSKNQTLENLYKSNKVLIIKTTLENDTTVINKIIF